VVVEVVLELLEELEDLTQLQVLKQVVWVDWLKSRLLLEALFITPVVVVVVRSLVWVLEMPLMD
jgi:hypothetical protein